MFQVFYISLPFSKWFFVLSRRSKILSELVRTEEKYVSDLQAVLEGYRDKLDRTYIRAKTGT